MTKKGMVLSVILGIILFTLAVIICMQIYSQKAVEKEEAKQVQDNPDFALNVTNGTGVDLRTLKLYKLPILIQVGSDADEISSSMRT